MYHNHQAIVNLFGGNGPVCLSFEPHDDHTVSDLKRRLASMTHIDTTDQRISTLGGRPLSDDDLLFNDPQGPVTFNLSLRLLGGKGGFGSMLRAQGGRMNAQKTTNFEACRDLQGRRIRTVNEERRLQDALAAQPEIERARQEAIKKKIEDGLKEREPKKFRFDDTQFLEDREQAMEGVKSAVSSILKKQTKKPKQQVVAMSLLFGDEMDDEDDDEDEGDDDEQPNDAEGDSESQQQQDTQKSSSGKESTKDKGKGKASTTSQGKQSASSSGNDDNEDDDNENSNNKNLLSDFMEANYDEEYDSEEDEDFEENDEDEGSTSDDDLEEEDFEAEEEEDEPIDTAAATKASSSGSSKEDKGKGKVTRKRKEREE
ncbi:hypothetical protein RO3G_09056 [Lichtheimia corymbifera JMRC:FSU:9682]|uniref:SDE2-like domain-containing protein n=1 Tax=Lichtheimia corymbifera JMRC:FSU:9682 TaxID=1263082 RepID=A0A068S610_9FUNG|nr:hypothetical protein RO3G_09056 [Lichtheimia corymbifera JMRC:FSU:9682]